MYCTYIIIHVHILYYFMYSIYIMFAVHIQYILKPMLFCVVYIMYFQFHILLLILLRSEACTAEGEAQFITPRIRKRWSSGTIMCVHLYMLISLFTCMSSCACVFMYSFIYMIYFYNYLLTCMYSTYIYILIYNVFTL